MFKLYYTPGTCALASHIALEDAGAPYEAVRISFKTNQQNSPEYLAINPKGRVPSLVTDREPWRSLSAESFSSFSASLPSPIAAS